MTPFQIRMRFRAARSATPVRDIAATLTLRAEPTFREVNMPSAQSHDPMQRITRQVADCFSEDGYAFVEDDKLEALAAALTSFLTDARIPVNASADTKPSAAR